MLSFERARIRPTCWQRCIVGKVSAAKYYRYSVQCWVLRRSDVMKFGYDVSQPNPHVDFPLLVEPLVFRSSVECSVRRENDPPTVQGSERALGPKFS